MIDARDEIINKRRFLSLRLLRDHSANLTPKPVYGRAIVGNRVVIETRARFGDATIDGPRVTWRSRAPVRSSRGCSRSDGLVAQGKKTIIMFEYYKKTACEMVPG